jgi:aspartyl-tRNA(Asn)/glutamyl-tRNA(Gln) amidotransferase subunit A
VALLLEAIFERGKNQGKLLPRRSSSARGPKRSLGIPKEFFLEVLDAPVEATFQSALRILEKSGVRLKDISIPQIRETEDAGTQIALAESTLYHQQAGWYPQRAEDYGEDVRLRLELGTKITAVKYLRAREFRESFKAIFHDAMAASRIDAVVSPTTPIVAPGIGEESVKIKGAEHATRALLLRLNRPANLLGVPAISVPCGLTKGGLPVGLQLIAEWTDEPLLLEIARKFERQCPLMARPDLSSVD